MPTLTVAGCTLDYTLLDLTPPWVEAPETVVLHHGLGACQDTFLEWLPALIDRYRVLRFDMRGHGRSSRQSPGTVLDMDILTDDLFAVMDAAGLARAHLMGESIGGTVALAAALRAPERVATLTVSNGAHLGASIQSVSDWKAIIDRDGMAGWSAHMMRGRFFDGAIPEKLRHWYETQQAGACPEVVLQGLATLVGADLVGRLGGLQPPVLLLHPDSSPFIPVPVMADFKNRVPNGRLHVIGHARHGLPVSHAKTCSMLLRGFLDELRT
jgi:pimeloyl-ACP methyl ester carboxylesterase